MQWPKPGPARVFLGVVGGDPYGGKRGALVGGDLGEVERRDAGDAVDRHVRCR